NTGGAALKEETEPVANDFLDRVFENGSEGDLYRIDDEWWMTDDWSRRNRNADWKFKGTFAPGRYWTEWMKRTKETEFDYSDLISFFYQITRNRYSREEINRIIDPYATLQMCAVRGFVGDWDSFSLNRGKNGYFYRRYSDGRFQFLHWDSDLAFRDTNGPFYNGVPGFPLWMSKGYNQKIFWDYIAELVKKYTAGSARVSAWMDAEEDASSMYSINKGFYENYFDDRARFARSEMNDGLSRDFYCVLDGRVVETRYDEFNISGSAPYGVFNVIAVGHPEAEFEWISDINWDLKNVRLHAGTNHVTIQALDAEGTPIHEAQTTLIKTTPAPPVIDIQAQPASWHVELSETFTIDATESRDLDGGDLELEWSVTPSAGVLLDTNRYGRCAMTFSSPGNYTVKLIATADSGERTSFLREVSVFAPGDFDSFAGSSLSDKWMLENLAQRGNTPAASWISLLMKPGFLTMKTQDNSIKPLNTSEAFLRLVRPIPTDTDWAFETELELENRFFGYFDTGLIITTLEDGVTNRYTLGVQDGALLSVKRIIESGATNEVTELKVVKWNADSAKIRVRRLGGYLTFERFENNGWLSLCARQIGEDAVASSAGLFSATDTMAQNLEVNFDYAMLVVPDLEQPAENLLKITEIMYNPVGGEDYEFIELLNAGTNTINLEGFEFTDGIYYVFPETELAPGKRIVVVRNRDAFISRYGDTGITIAEGEYSGKLANDGERLVLTDPDGYDLITIEYSDSGAWPARADGLGGSLEIIDQHGDPNNPANWRASARYNGSPGAAPIDAAPRVVINEVLANTDYPLEDAVELFNNSSEPVDISGWYLSDDSENLRKYEIPDGSIIEPNDYIVFYEYQFNSNNNANPFSLNGNEGEEAILVSADAGGNLEYFIDSLEFGLMENGVALGRYPNGIGDFAPMCWITLGVEVDLNDPNFTNDEFISGGGAPNAYPIVGPVVFNEIMYHPNEDGTLEYVVITNITEEEVLLFDPAHATNVWKLANAVEFEFDPATIIPAGGKLVVSCVEPDVLREVYDIESQTPIQGPWNGRLDNSGETIELRRSAAPVVMDDGSGFVPYILVERISYKPVSPWPIEADGLGPSLKRIDPTLYGNDPSNWSTEWIEAMRDEDGDGMDDDWELQFGLNPDNPGDAVGDEDGDGQTNLSEFIAGTDPTNPDSLFLVDAVLGDGDHVILDFTAQPQRRYVIESTDALDSEVWSEVGVIQPKQNEQPIQYIDERPLNASRFYRVRVFLER
ncbi:MAG: lamin tail domain-containing protein, partial [Verrucomicrobia bacterium]|nr:lamin tail domain-containing protein [Verrucomicrobiota bacterium]